MRALSDLLRDVTPLRPQAFLQALLERAPDGHCSAHALHMRGDCRISLREFLEGKAQNLRDDVGSKLAGVSAEGDPFKAALLSRRRALGAQAAEQ